jgi:hypothetical protein
MLVGIQGYKGAGKDSFAARLASVARSRGIAVERLMIADALKESVCVLFGISRDALERAKNEPHAMVTLRLGLARDAGGETMTFRSFLQRYGTESHRDILGEGVWLDRALPEDFEHDGRLVIVTDSRMPNEVERVRSLGGFIVQVHDGRSTGDGHASEVLADDPDFVIDNTVRGDGFAFLAAQAEGLLSTISFMSEAV